MRPRLFRFIGFFSLLFALVSTTATAEAAERKTTFDPQKHGFRFSNTFNNDFVGSLDVRTGGLCGGMVYAALDYFHTKRAIPSQDYRPANRTPLQSYIYKRQVDSLVPNIARWADVGLNPNGARDSELFRRGHTSEQNTLRRYIDRGEPVPLGLQPYDGETHQVLAIGYRSGPRAEDFEVLVYDPNFPGQTIAVRPDMAGKYFYYVNKLDKKTMKYAWRTFFVDPAYKSSSPPTVPSTNYPTDGKIRELVVRFDTGDDDLRGGKDNVNLIVHLRDGTRVTSSNINLGARWLSNYSEHASVRLPRPIARADIHQVEFTTTFTGGISGDNWDVKHILVEAYDGPRRVVLAERPTFIRFTGSMRSVRLNVQSANATGPATDKITRLQVILGTGGDDLRGNNDNVNATVLFRDGKRHTVHTINARQRWKDHTSTTVFIPLDRARDRSEIVGLILETTSRGGIGGDNWNLDKLEIAPVNTVGGKGSVYYSRTGKPLNRFTGSKPQFTARW